MSYDPSHRKPPRQERWPQATPPDAWPSYRDDDAHRDEQQSDSWYAADRQGAYPATASYQRKVGYQGASGGPEDRDYQSAVATDTFPPARNGYGATDGYGGSRGGYAGTVDGYPGAADGYADAGDSFAGGPDPFSRVEGGYGQATDEYASDATGYDWSQNGYGEATDGHGGAPDGYSSTTDGYGEGPDGFAGSAGYLGPGSYTEPGFSDPMLMAPDADVHPYRWQADQDLRREAGQRGLVVGAVTGLLAVAVAIGVSTLAAGFAGLQVSPMSALGSVFIDRMPTALKNAAVQHFGTHGRTVLLLVMYAAIAVLAMGIGVLARHAAAPGVAGLAAFSLIAAFVTITRPGGRVSDVAPAIIGGIAGVMALLWLRQASAPSQRPQRVPPLRQARASGPRRAR